MNLIVNAQDAIPDGGKLTMSTSLRDLDEAAAVKLFDVEAGQYAVIEVTDTGRGMDEATLERIFEPFFSTKSQQGTGLGLATVFGIVKQHGGHIWVYSELDKGTTFKVYLPVTGEEVLDKSETRSRHQELRGSETILLAEDSGVVRDLAVRVLERQGYSVLAAADGIESLKLLETSDDPIGLLLSDVIMPGMNGKELHVKIAEKHPDVKVLFMSGYTDEVVGRSGIDGRVSFIQKPFTPLTLAAKVREVLDEK